MIIGCDLGGLRASIVAKARVLIRDAIGIESARVMVTATHTHSAPVVAQWIGVGKEDVDYLSALPGKIAEAVITAGSRLETVEALAYGEAPFREWPRNREYRDDPSGSQRCEF